MIKVIICGINGFMGNLVADALEASGKATVVAGIDLEDGMRGETPVYKNIFDCSLEADVIVDFSHPSALDANLSYALLHGLALVICATGYSAQQRAAIENAGKSLPVFFSANMSLGVNLMFELCRQAAAFFGMSADIEIIEKHHHRKLDAPSGTAITLAETIQSALPEETNVVYGRAPGCGKRPTNEIGMHSVRGGTIVGEHSALFILDNEVLEIKHTAENRAIFAAGAVRAVLYIAKQQKGLYNMGNVIADEA